MADKKGKKAEITVRIDLSRLTIGDLEVLDKASSGDMPLSAIVDFLDRIVDGDVRAMPLTELPRIMEALQDAIGGVMEGN